MYLIDEKHVSLIMVCKKRGKVSLTLDSWPRGDSYIDSHFGCYNMGKRGLSKTRVCRDIGEMLAGNTLLLAYNAHFDLSFLYYMLLRDGDPMILKGKDKLDLLTVYKDRRAYPHKLCNAIEAYGLAGSVVNSHRAVDDVLATLAVMGEMEAERDDLISYVNLFGYNPKYGIDGKPIGSVIYKPQGFEPGQPLYL